METFFSSIQSDSTTHLPSCVSWARRRLFSRVTEICLQETVYVEERTSSLSPTSLDRKMSLFAQEKKVEWPCCKQKKKMSSQVEYDTDCSNIMKEIPVKKIVKEL